MQRWRFTVKGGACFVLSCFGVADSDKKSIIFEEYIYFNNFFLYNSKVRGKELLNAGLMGVHIMKKKIIVLLMVFIFSTVSGVFAATVYLKNGSKIEGELVQKTGGMVKVNVGGVTITYYMDEIDRIEGGGDVAVSPAAKVSSAPVPAAPAGIPVPAVPTPPVAPAVSGSSQSLAPVSAPSATGGIANKRTVLQYLELSGTKESLDQTFKQMMDDAKPEDAQRLRAGYNIEEIMEILVPIYQKYLTQEDFQKLIEFYQSPAARKLQEVTPPLMEDALNASLQYFQAKLPPPAR